MKQLTREQLQARKDKAVRFVRDFLHDPDRADEIEDEDLDSYAEMRRIQVIMFGRKNNAMANVNGQTKKGVFVEIDDLRQENQDLRDQLDAVADIVAPPEEEDDEDSADEG